MKLKETYSYGEGVLIYLARYLRGGPISNKRIHRVEDGEVTFNFGRKSVRLFTLPIQTFIGLYLQHVLPPKFVTVRSYGLYHHVLKEDLALCREILGQPPVEDVGFLDWQSLWQERSEAHPKCCPVCGKQLIAFEVLTPEKKPRKVPIPCNKGPDIEYLYAA